MAGLYHGSFSYSPGPTARDLQPAPDLHDIRVSSKGQVSAADKFVNLSEIFRNSIKGSSEASVSNESYDGGPGSIHPGNARDAALPCLSFAPVHALAIGLEPFEEEPLKGIVFGNISPDNYIDLFWDVVQHQNDKNAGKLVVYEAEQSAEPRFLVCFQEQLFELRYIRCDVLVREYPKVSHAPDEFLQDPENRIPKAVQDVIKMLQRGPSIREHLDTYPSIRKAYSFIKRWVAIRGLANSLPDNQIFKILLGYQKSSPNIITVGETSGGSLPGLIHTFISNDAYKVDVMMDSSRQWPAANEEGWENWLSRLSTQPTSEKGKYAHTIRVMVTYSGVSQIKGAQWLLMVQRKLSKLQERLERNLSPRRSVSIWPYRLVSPDATPTDAVYEGSFILGFGLSTASMEKDMTTIQEATSNWLEQVKKDKTYAEGHCFIRFSYSPLPALKICERKWPRLVLTGENVLEEDSTDSEKPRKSKQSSKVKLSALTATDKAPRFRTANEVLNRLKHDSAYNLDDFVIGYLDRVKEKIVEKHAADWDRETTAEEFIPEHRIEYFKRCSGEKEGEIIWQKKGKVDNIFV